MKKFLLFGLLFLFSFIVVVIARAPVGPVWNAVEDDVYQRVSGLQVLRVGGTVWAGNADLRYRAFPPSRLNWEISPAELISGKIAFIAYASGEAHRLDSHGSVSQSETRIEELTGTIGSDFINLVSTNYGLNFSGEVVLSDIGLTTDQRWFTAAEGHADWSGGKIYYDSPHNGQTIFLPPLRADISMADKNLQLRLHNNQAALIDIVLRPNGWAVVEVKARLFDLARIPWPGGSSPEDTVLQFEEKLF
ncbi:MAG: type II secretion system protein N [Pseudomonadales bacterium]|nr:type II secretion system protein N [Pseudomonadales bacterium]